MDLYEIRRIFDLIIKEKASQVDIDAANFGSLLHGASLRQLKKKIGLPEQYQPGMPLPAEAFELNKLSGSDLAPFKVEKGGQSGMPLTVDENGVATTPSDMYYPSTLTYKHVLSSEIKYRPLDWCSDKEFDEKRASSIEYPTKKYPIANIQNGFIRVLPANLRYLDFIYIKFPTKPVYATKTTNGFEEYDIDNSTQLEWNDINILDIIYSALAELGVSITKEDVYNYSEKIKTTGK